MTYRKSNYDPLAVNGKVHPIIRPFDGWQWVGVLASVAATALFALWIAEKANLLNTGFDSVIFAFPFFLGGGTLLRRDPDLPAGVLGDRKWNLVAVLLGFALLPIAFAD